MQYNMCIIHTCYTKSESYVGVGRNDIYIQYMCRFFFNFHNIILIYFRVTAHFYWYYFVFVVSFYDSIIFYSTTFYIKMKPLAKKVKSNENLLKIGMWNIEVSQVKKQMTLIFKTLFLN